MASTLNRTIFTLSKVNNLFMSKPGFCTIAHTLSVKETIDKKRHQAAVGGGQKRIEAQHRKVK